MDNNNLDLTEAITLLETMERKGIDFIDFRFTDVLGGWHHITYRTSLVDAPLLVRGLMFDGSSIAGWRSIEKSDMILRPDLKTGYFDTAEKYSTYVLICDVLDPETQVNYNRDPRSIARSAIKNLNDKNIGDAVYFGPELEFFIFDNVRFANEPQDTFFKIDSKEASYSSSKEYESGNHGHRPGVKGGYMPLPPVDATCNIRSEILLAAEKIGFKGILHHHEVAESQCEVGFQYGDLLSAADNTQKMKHLVHNIVVSHGKTATFMPKPIKGDNGSGMHVHQSIWKDGENLFYSESGYAGLSEFALYYIGGIIKHAKAINAFANPCTNSYKRLVPGFEAPVILAYSASNRSASIRIPFSYGKNAKRIEVRFPDPTANPYLTFAALMMAGLDGINNKIHPGEPSDYNLYQNKAPEILSVCHSLREALEYLNRDREFLKVGNVFTDDFIDAYIGLKMEEVQEFESAPHPIEFKLYFSS